MSSRFLSQKYKDELTKQERKINEICNTHIPTYSSESGLMSLFPGMNLYIGKSTSGKTYLAMKQIESCYYATNASGKALIKNGSKVSQFTEIIIVTLNQSTGVRWQSFFKKNFNRDVPVFPTADLLDLYKGISTRHSRALKQFGYGPKTLLIFDDCAGASDVGNDSSDARILRNMPVMISIATSGRNLDLYCCFMAQSPKHIPNECYDNAKYMACFNLNNINTREDHVFPKMLSSCTKSLPHLTTVSKNIRNIYFHREMDSLRTYECLVRFEFVKRLPNGEFQEIEKIYKYRAP